jgi:hypothetical protein
MRYLLQFFVAAVDDRVWQGHMADPRTAGPGEDVHEERLEVFRSDGDRRLATSQDRQRVESGP